MIHSFCQHIVATAAPLVVEDARDHDVVRTNVAVSELGVIAYVGMPLTDEAGVLVHSDFHPEYVGLSLLDDGTMLRLSDSLFHSGDEHRDPWVHDDLDSAPAHSDGSAAEPGPRRADIPATEPPGPGRRPPHHPTGAPALPVTGVPSRRVSPDPEI